MNKTKNIALIALCFTLAVFAEINLPTNIPGSELSQKRIQIAQNELLEYYKQTENANEAEAAKAVSTRMSKLFTGYITNSKPYTVDECLVEARQRLDKAAKRAFPQLTEAELKKKAEEKYPLYKIGDKVKVLYCTNPLYPSKIEGTYNGERNGYIRIGQASIRRQDMERVKGNEDEILKFDAATTEAKRKKFIKSETFRMIDGQRDFIAQNEEAILAATIKDYTAKNENNGFTFLDGEWLAPADLLKQMAAKAEELYNAALEAERKAELQARADIANVQAASLEFKNQVYPSKMRLDPTEVLKAQAESKRKQEELLAKEKAEEEERLQKAAEAAELAKQRAEAKKRKKEEAAAGNNASGNGNNEGEESFHSTMTIFTARNLIIIIVIFVVVAAVTVAIIITRRKRDEKRFTQFFEGKGEIQKKFWAQAEADPENFKYVSYLFPDENEAINALLQLSYFSGTPDGNIKCSHDVLFGTYQHQGKAVAFIGGTNLRYAPWREATAVLPELPNAQYFKVSSEPIVKLDLPTFDDHNITELGKEEMRGEDGSITLCYRYSADSKENAMAFLEKLHLDEEGIMIQVETPEGKFGKDKEGIFALDN